MANEDNIINNMTFSFSNVNSFNTCKYGWKLSYLDKEKRIGNAFSDYGLLAHQTLELYFSGDLEVWDLPNYYQDHYGEFLKNNFPLYPPKMAESYYNSGLYFFENFDFNKNDYEILMIEDTIKSEYKGIKIVVKPDLLLKSKKDGSYILFDYKTSKLKDDKIKLDYQRQFYIYSYFIFLDRDIEINKIKIWYIRDNKILELKIDPFEVQEALDWFENTVNDIKKEKDWNPNLSKENNYFCGQICSFRENCKYRK